MSVSKKLSAEDLNDVSGGYIYAADEGWQVIDDKNGKVLKGPMTWRNAIKYCQENGLDTKEIDWMDLNKLRKTGSIY